MKRAIPLTGLEPRLRALRTLLAEARRAMADRNYGIAEQVLDDALEELPYQNDMGTFIYPNEGWTPLTFVEPVTVFTYAEQIHTRACKRFGDAKNARCTCGSSDFWRQLGGLK